MSRKLVVRDGVRTYVSVDFKRSIIFVEPFEVDLGMDVDEMQVFRFFASAKSFGAKMQRRGWKVVGCRRPGPREHQRPGFPCIGGRGVVDLINSDEEMANGVAAFRTNDTVSYYAFFWIDENEFGGSAYRVWLLGSTTPYDVRFSLTPSIAACDCQGFHASSWCNHLAVISTLAMNCAIHVEKQPTSSQVSKVMHES